MSLAQNEGLLRYQVIATELRTEIVSGTLEVGAMLPTEMELCARYDVSRYTVRAALRQLREEGLASMRRGSGTRVVAIAPKDTYVQSVNSLSELLRYPNTTFELSDSGTVTPAPANAKRLCSPARLKLVPNFRRPPIHRKRTADLLAGNIRHSRIRSDRATAADRTWAGSPHHRKRAQGGDHQGTAGDDRQSGLPELADRLDVEPGSAAMTIIRRYTAQDERVFETTVSVHPEGRFVYSLKMTRDWTAI